VEATNTPPPAGYVSIAQAAQIIGAKPWDVVRLIESERVKAIRLVDLESLRRHQAQENA
jgi:hypothetical protein